MSNSTIRNTLFSSINIYLEYFLGLVISILIARTLGPELYGIYSYLIWFALLLVILANAGINTGAIKFFSEVRAKDEHYLLKPLYGYFRRVQIIKAAVVISVTCLILLLRPELIVDEEYTTLAFVVVFAVVLKSYHMFRVGVYKGMERFDYLAFTVMVVSPANLALVLVAHFAHSDLSTFVNIYFIACFLYWLISYFYSRKLGKEEFSAIEQKKHADLPLKRINHHLKVVSVNSVIGFIVVGQSELFFLKHFAPAADIGFFNIGYVLAGAAMMLVPGVYSSVLLPIIARSVADPKGAPDKAVKQSTRYIYILSILVAFPLAIFADDVVTILYGEGFERAAWVFRIFILVAVIKNFRESINAYLMSSDRQAFLLKITIWGLVASLILDFFLIKEYGLSGAVIAYCIVNVSITLFLMVHTYNKLSAWPNWFKMIKATLIGVACGCISILAANTFDSVFMCVVGGALYVALFAPLIVILDCFEAPDYAVMSKLVKKIPPASRYLHNKYETLSKATD